MVPSGRTALKCDLWNVISQNGTIHHGRQVLVEAVSGAMTLVEPVTNRKVETWSTC